MYAIPKPILEQFQNGAFASNIKGFLYSSVDVDEAHEILINKDCKSALTHSLPTDMDKICQTLEYQAKLITNLENQLADVPVKQKCQRDFSQSVISSEFANTKVYFEKIQKSHVFSDDKSPHLFQAFSNIIASNVQQHNLLNFRDIGRGALNLYIQSNILKDPSVEKPRIRKHNLHTFTKKGY